MKFLFLFFLFINISFANSQNISRMNALKKVIQKEEYIALAINKYILQTATIPKTSENILDWSKLEVDDYLGSGFNRTNPLTSDDMYVYYDTSSHNFFVRGVVIKLSESETNFDSDLSYLYNFYSSRIFRVNTLAPINTTEEKLLIGSQIIYSSVQKEIVDTLNLTSPEVNTIKLDSQDCDVGTYYYELKGEELTYKYCKSDDSVTVYQESPIYVEDLSDLQYIKAKIGDIAYAKYNGSWYEYYYQGDTTPPWIPEYLGTTLNSDDEDENIEDLILNYIPNAKDLVFRRDGGCMLANGDIFCWGNNQYKKAGIENYGQLDTTLSPDYVNTPVMLKVQIDNLSDIDGVTRRDKNWYNNPFRVKFEKMAMNSTNVCGISPIFGYTSDGITRKFGGNLFCNGNITSTYFDDLEDGVTETSVLKKNFYFDKGKADLLNNNNEIYLQDIVMVEDTGIALSDAGEIYTFGKNYKGALGIGSDDKFKVTTEPLKLGSENDTTYPVFEKIFALRDIKSIGAIDENNEFWIWGERPDGTIFNEPTQLNTSKKFNKDAIYVNTNEFVLKSVDNVFYKTIDNNGKVDITEVKDSSGALIPNTATSVSVFGDYYLYINENSELMGSEELLKCMKPSELNECTNTKNKNLFLDAIAELNDKSNSINGKNYANFANASIFKLDSVIVEEFEDFEGDASTLSGWSVKKIADDSEVLDSDRTTNPPLTVQSGTLDTTRINPTQVLGRIMIGTEYIEKTYNFGSAYANNEVEVEFDFFEIDSWDFEKLNVELNGENFTDDGFIHDNHESFQDTNDSGIYIQNLGSDYSSNTKYNDEKYHYKMKHVLDSNGDLTIKFSTRFLESGEEGTCAARDDNEPCTDWALTVQGINDESWAIDNVHVKVKETNKKFVCAMTGFNSESQMYCWGNVNRSIPVLSTSLYDIDKISTINKLFITQEDDKEKRMGYRQYSSTGNNDDGKLFLRFPTYIGGFDYGFYFK